MCGVSSGGTSPSLPVGATAITGTALTNSGGSATTRTGMNVGWTTATSSTTPSGVCGTGTTDTVMMVYRGQSASPIGPNVGTESGNNSNTSVSYNSDTLSVTDGSSWFAGFAVRNIADSHLNGSPPTMFVRTSIPATPVAVGLDTNGPTASNLSLGGVNAFSASSKYTSVTLEIRAAQNITVGATGTQVSSVIQGSTANYTGGAFTFVRDVGTANITSIKIHDVGTINANSNLSNLILLYKQEAACSPSIPTGTTQFNSTGGSFNASEDSTVTGTMAVGTSQICVYAQIDVSAGANIGDTIELQITNPATDTLASVGTTSPSSAVAIAGTTTVISSAPTTDQLLRGGEYFSGGSKQGYYWAN